VNPLPRHARDENLPEPARPEESRRQCSLCGYRFATARESVCRCGISRGCSALGCPHCGHRLAPESATLSWIGRIVRRLLAGRAEARALERRQ
jgi:hypothetical protein